MFIPEFVCGILATIGVGTQVIPCFFVFVGDELNRSVPTYITFIAGFRMTHIACV